MEENKATRDTASDAKDDFIRSPRHDWEAQFAKMAQNGDDTLTEIAAAPNLSEWDAKEWEWGTDYRTTSRTVPSA